MYDGQVCPDGTIVRNTTDGPSGQQLLLNYCFGHPESTVVLCPVSERISTCVLFTKTLFLISFKIMELFKNFISMGRALIISITIRRERISEFNGQ